MASDGYANGFHAHQVLGNFSVDEKGIYRNDRRMRRTFVEPDDDVRNMDLLEGIDDYDAALARVELGQGKQPSSMTSLLEWLRDHRGELVGHDILKISETDQAKRLDIDFVGKRGVFCRLLRAIGTTDRVEVLVTQCNGTYYMEIMRDADETTASIETNYSLKNFKRHVTLVDGVPPDVNNDDYSLYCSVMKTECGDHKILLSSEVQAERDDRPPPRRYVDIKLIPRINTDQAKSDFERCTTLKWWSHAVVSGTPEILCGWRSRDYFNKRPILSSVELIRTDELPERAPMTCGDKRWWEPETCLDTFHILLANIKELVEEDDPRAVFRLELPVVEQGRGVKSRLQARRFNLLGRREDDYVILPEWYLEDFLNIQDD